MHDRAELLLETREPIGPLLDHRELVPHLEQRARHVRSDLATSGDDDVHHASCGAGALGRTVSRRTEIAVCVGHTVFEPALGIELGSRGVEHADDDRARAVAALEDLPDHDVRVVTGRGDDCRVGLGDPGLLEHAHVHAVADDEAATPAGAETHERVFALVDDRDVPAVGDEALRDRGANSPAPDDQRFHGGSAYSSKTPSGNATTRTSHGARRSTKSTVGEKKRD